MEEKIMRCVQKQGLAPKGLNVELDPEFGVVDKNKGGDFRLFYFNGRIL